MYASPSRLSNEARERVSASLNDRLVDGIDLHSQIKVAHWNIKGPHFAALHPLFDGFATSLALHNDNLAERAVALGRQVEGTARHVAGASRLTEYPQETKRDLDHVRLLSERFESYLDGLRQTRSVAEEQGDTDTVDLLTGIVTEFEKHTWFLLASLDGPS
jgi:starvation-inducible DNA-binding protein